MTVTGLPVTVSLLHWLAETGASNSSWFQLSHHHHAVIKSMHSNGLDTGFSSNDQAIAQQFLVWLGVFVLSFDGGIFTNHVSHVSIQNQTLHVQWVNGLSQTLMFNNWNHATRNGLNHIIKRACSEPMFSKNIPYGLQLIGAYLGHHLTELNTLIEFSEGAQSTKTMVDELGFYALSAAPEPLLQLFYLELSECLPKHLGFEGQQAPMPARTFFSKPVSSATLLIDKVKMHYNLMNHAHIDADLKESLRIKTASFLSALQMDEAAWGMIQNEIGNLINNQLKPRANYLAMVLDVFWKK